MNNSDDDAGTRWVSGFTRWAIRLWIIQFLLALYFTTVTNLVFGIPVGQVVNVQLSLQLFLPITLVVLYIGFSLWVHDFSDWLHFAASAFAYALTPFAAITGYKVYAYFAGVSLADQSFVYAGFLHDFSRGLTYLEGLGSALSIPHSEFIGTPTFFGWAQLAISALGLLLPLLQTGISRWMRA